VNMIVSNNAIVQNAVRLNSKQETTAMQQQHATLSQLQTNVDAFNEQQLLTMTAWRQKYLALQQNAIQLGPPATDNLTWCDVAAIPTQLVNFTFLMAITGPSSKTLGGMKVFCPLQAVQAIPFMGFDENEFEAEMTVAVKDYINAARVVITRFFAAIAVFIGFCIVMDVGFEVYWHAMKKLGAVRIRKKMWFEPRSHNPSLTRARVRSQRLLAGGRANSIGSADEAAERVQRELRVGDIRHSASYKPPRFTTTVSDGGKTYEMHGLAE